MRSHGRFQRIHVLAPQRQTTTLRAWHETKATLPASGRFANYALQNQTDKYGELRMRVMPVRGRCSSTPARLTDAKKKGKMRLKSCPGAMHPSESYYLTGVVAWVSGSVLCILPPQTRTWSRQKRHVLRGNRNCKHTLRGTQICIVKAAGC